MELTADSRGRDGSINQEVNVGVCVIISTAGVNAAEVHVALFKYERLFLLQLVCFCPQISFNLLTKKGFCF